MKKSRLVFTLLIIGLLLAGSVEAKTPSKGVVRKAYRSYVNKNYSAASYLNPSIKYYDINRDGVQECFFIFEQGPRYGARILTYKGGKVYSVLSDRKAISSIYYNKSAKSICVLNSGGAWTNWFNVYQLKGRKLKRIVQYHVDGNFSTGIVSYYKNNKAISKSEFVNATDPYYSWKRL